MSKTHKITLSPLGWYFFGGEKTLDEGNTSNYFAKSNFLPQETALLGMLRFELLKASELLPISSANKNKVEALIGSESFNYLNKGNDCAHFGAIKSISPVFIQKGNDVLYKMPMNYDKEDVFSEGATKGAKVCFTSYNENAKLPYIQRFKSKGYSSDRWVSLAKGEVFAENDIFQTTTKIGITKLEKERIEREDGKKGFFKTIMCTLKPDYSFVFYANLETDVLLGSRLVNLGAERSVFNMKVENLQKDETSFDISLKNNLQIPTGQLLFISDAFVDSSVLAYCRFSWIETIPFRNLTRKNKENGSYASLDKKGEKSGRYNLIKRGSVLYFNPEKVEEITQLISNAYLQAYGYNNYVINETTTKK